MATEAQIMNRYIAVAIIAVVILIWVWIN